MFRMLKIFLFFSCLVMSAVAFAEEAALPIDEAEMIALFETEYDKQRFENAKKAGTVAAYQGYLSGCQKPYCNFAEQAQRAYWALIEAQATVAIYETFFTYCDAECAIYPEVKPLYDTRLQEENYEAKIHELALKYQNAEAYRAYLSICRLCLHRDAVENLLQE